jgi:isocitrate/isopropylmalate dehydrogenase
MEAVIVLLPGDGIGPDVTECAKKGRLLPIISITASRSKRS